MNNSYKNLLLVFSPDAPPSKVTVTSEEKDIPRPISPPAQLEETKPPIIVATSPLLPALVKYVFYFTYKIIYLF